MKISKRFVNSFFVLFFIIIFINILSLATKSYQMWMFYLLLICIALLLYLIFRKNPSLVGKIFAYGIPIFILVYVLYWNVLPFGYAKTYVIDVGTEGDTDSSNEFYLVENEHLGVRQTYNGSTFRELNGRTTAIFQPLAVLNNATVSIELEGDGVFLGAPQTFDYREYDWDLYANFKNKIPNYLDIEIDPEGLKKLQYHHYENYSRKELHVIEGNAEKRENCLYFDGTSNMMYYPIDFDGIYIEWTPMDNSFNDQQIIGNEFFSMIQNSESVILRGNKGKDIKYKVNTDFFNKTHNALIVIAEDKLLFFVDNNYVSDIDAKELGFKLFFGRIPDQKGNYFTGCIAKVEVIQQDITYFNMNTKQKELMNVSRMIKDGCAYFDGMTRLVYPDTADDFEEGPFSVYVEWTPENFEKPNQELIGHYNWEIWQQLNSVLLRVGRMNDKKGPFFTIQYQVNDDFFGKKHNAIFIYNPGEQGYIELFIDSKFIGRKNIGTNKIYNKYSRDLSFGKSMHGSAEYYNGCISKAFFMYSAIQRFKDKQVFVTSDNIVNVDILGNGKIKSIRMKVKN